MGKNNVQLREEKNTVIQHWGLRKLSIGVASVLLGTTAYLGINNGAVVHADTVTTNNNNENVTTSNNGTLSQNLYQSDHIQTSKTAVNTNSTGNTQTTSQDVTSSKNDNQLIAANNSNKQVDGQQNYQQAEQSVSTEKQLNLYLVLAVQDNNNSSGSTELNDNNSWGSTIHYTYGTDAQLTEDQKKIGYVADSSKAGQAVYPDSQIKVGFDSQQNQMKVTVDGQKVSFTQTDKGYKTGTSDVATDYDNLKGHVYRLFDITFTLPLNSSDGNYHGTYNTYTLQCSSDMTNGKLVFKTQDTALNDYFYQQKFTTEFKYVDYSNDKTVYQTVPGPDVLSNGQTVTYQYQVPNGYDLLLSSKTLTMTLNSNGFSYSGYWKLDPSSTPTHYVFLVPVTKSYTSPKVDESFGQITGGVITEDGKPFDFNSGWWGQTRYGLDFATHSFKEKSKTDWINDLKTSFSILTDELGIMNDKHVTSVYDYMNSGQAAKDFPFFGSLNIYLPIDSSGKWLTNADYLHPSQLGNAKVNVYPFFSNEVFSGYNIWIGHNMASSLSSDLDNMHTLWGLDSSVFSAVNGFVNSFPDQVLKQNGAVTGVLQYQGIRVTAKDNKSGKVLSVNNLDYLSFLKQYNYQYLLDNMKKGISYDFSVIVKPYSFSVQKKNYTVHFRYANGPKAGQTFRNDWHGYVDVIMLDNIPIAYSMDGTVAGFSDINPAGPIPNGMYLTAMGYFSNPKAFLKSNESNLLNYTFVNQTDVTHPGTGAYFDGYQAGVIGIDGPKLTSLLSPNYRIDKDNLLFANKDQLFYNTPRFNWNTITRDQAIQMANSYEIHNQKKNTSLDYLFENVDATPAELTVNALYTEPTTKVTLNYVDAASNKVLSTSTLNLNTNVVTGADLKMPENYALVSKPASQNNVNLVYGADGNLSTISLAHVSSTPIVINLKVKPSIAHITYQFVDDDNNGAFVGKAVTVSGNNVDFNLSIPANYGLVVGQVFPSKVDASVDGKSYVVHLCHLKQVVPRAKRVKRVINYVDEQGHSLHQSVTQDAGIVVEYGNKDLVTGDVVWGQYHADVSVGDTEGAFSEYYLPQYEGFTSYVNGVKSTVVPQAYVTYDANGRPVQLDTTVEVTYQSDKDLSNPSQPEIDSEPNDDQSGDTLTARRIINLQEPNTDVLKIITESISFVKDHDQKTLAAVTNPQIAGYYTTSQQVDGVTVDCESADKLVKTVNVVYHLAPESLHVHFYDADGNLIQSANVNGKYGQTVDVHSAIPAGWQLYAGQTVPNAVKLGTYNADLAFVLDHKITEIKPEMNVSTTDVIPGTNHLTYPSEALSSNLNRDLVYTVNVKHSNDKVKSKVFKQHVSRSAYLDLVTGKVVGYTNWTNNGQHTFNAFVAQPKDGYTINTLPAVTLDVDHPTKVANVSYVPKTVNGQVVYKTFDGQTVDTQNFIGNQSVNLVVPTGYKLATEVTSLQPTNEADQKYIFCVIPQVMTYTSHDDNKPANIGDLTKTVTRTINIKLSNGRTRTIKQLVRFERTARVDANGKVTYSNWQSIGRNKFNAVYVPKRVGYHVVIKQDGKVLPKVDQVVDISADANDSVINIEYVKN